MTARAALTVVGQVAGAWIGGPLGSAIGGVIGSFVGGAIDGPVRNQQSLIEDLGAIKFDYGTPWPRIYGVYRMPVTPLWSSEKRAVAHEEEVDAKGGPSAVNTSYTYEMDWLCAAPLNAIGFSRIWVNGELKYSALADSDYETKVASAQTTAWASVTFFDGNPSQMPWSIYEASVGTENASAYRHRPTIAFESLDLGGSGQPPLIAVEFFTAGQSEDVCVGADPQTQFVWTAGDAQPLSVGGWDNYEYFNWLVASNVATLEVTNYYYTAPAVHEQRVFEITTEAVSGGCRYAEILFNREDTSSANWTGYLGVMDDDGNNWGSSYSGYKVVNGVEGIDIAKSWSADGTVIMLAYKNGELWVGRNGSWLDGSPNVPDPSSGAYPTHTGIDAAIRLFVRYFAHLPDVELTLRTRDEDFSYPAPDGFAAWGSASFAAIEVWDVETVDLADVVRSEALLTWTGEDGLLDGAYLDTDELEGTEVTGYATTGSPVEAIAGLADVYYFGMSCAGDLKAVVRGGASVKTIPFDETGSGLDNPAEPFCGVGRRNDIEVPIQVSVTGPNYLTDYENGTETSDRLIGESVAVRTYNTAVVFTPAERKGRAETMVLDGRIGTNTAQLALDDTHVDLEPCDVVTAIDDEGNSYRLRIERETYSDSGRVFDVVLDDSSVLSTSGITAATDQRAITVRLPDPTESVLLDVPIFRDVDNDPGFYAVVHGNAQGASLLQSDDDTSFAEAATFSTESVFGTCTTTLGDWTGGVVRDEISSVTVDVGDGTLTSTTNDAMLASRSRNLALIGVHGRWEAVQFRTATLVSPGVYTLTGFLRGRFGTEWASVDHEADETFVLMTTSARRILKSTSDIGDEDFYKVVSVGQSIGAVDSEAFTAYAVGLKPYAPVHLRKSVETSNNIVLTWNRRSRLDCSFTGSGGVVVPIGEDSESYSIDVVVDDEVVRTTSTSSETLTYTRAQQIADGVFAATDFRFDVYQVSATVGRGYVSSLEATGTATPLPQITQITVGGSFESGADLRATLNGVAYDYETVGGDINLAGIATSFAAVIDAASAYSASAASTVITVTGQVSVPFAVSVSVLSDNVATMALVQTAALASAGTAQYVHTYITQPTTGVTLPIPASTTFIFRVENPIGTPVDEISYTTGASDTHLEVHQGLGAAMAANETLSALGYAYGGTITEGIEHGYAFGPIGDVNVYFSGFATNGMNLAVSVMTPATPAVSADRPQIVTLTLSGTPITGRVYRAKLGGVNYDYTATGGDTTMTHIATGLAAVIDAAASYLASSSGAVITITHASNNVSFTYAASIIGSTVTLSYNTTQEAA